MKKFIPILLFFYVNLAYCQNYYEQAYNAAIADLNVGNYKEAIDKTIRIQNAIGSNPKIEALLSEAYFHNNQYIKAKVAHNKLMKITPYAVRTSANFKPYIELGKQIDQAVRIEEKNFKENIQKRRMSKADAIVKRYDQRFKRKESSIKNGPRGIDFFLRKAIKEGTADALKKFNSLYNDKRGSDEIKKVIAKKKQDRGRRGAEGPTVDGKRQGQWNFYWRNGDIQQRVTYNNDKLVGPLKLYFDSNNQQTRDKNRAFFYRTVTYNQMGAPEAYFEEKYVDNNALKFVSYFKNFDAGAEGVLYFQDLKKSAKIFNRDGSKKAEYTLANGRKNGPASHYENQEKIYDCVYVNDVMEGRYQSYYQGGAIKQIIMFKNGKPYTHLEGFDRRGNLDTESNLKNGSGNLVIYGPMDFFKGEFDQLSQYYSFRNNPFFYKVKRNYKNGQVQNEYITLTFSGGNAYYFVQYNQNHDITFYGNFHDDPTYKNPGIVYAYNSNNTHYLIYNSGNLQSFELISNRGNLKISSFLMENVPPQYTNKAIYPTEQHPNGMIKKIVGEPFSVGTRTVSYDLLTVTRKNGKKKEIKGRDYYREYVFYENGLLKDIVYRKKTNKKILGRKYNPDRK